MTPIQDNGSPADVLPAQEPEKPALEVRPVIGASAAKRANASIMGMVLALLVTLAVVLPVILLNAHQNASVYRPDVDVPVIAAQARDAAGFAPASAALPQGWSVNYARWKSAGADGVAFWEVGYVSPSGQFISLKQSAHANPSWLAQNANNAPITGERQIGAHSWELRDKPGSDKSLILPYRGTTMILTGSAPLTDFDVLGAAAIASTDIQLDAPATGTPTGTATGTALPTAGSAK
ncbi:DUF4245 domain-containing protein [Arthrobacter sp. H14-L1]|uniref:DUF4245 domain-containing protein n=1 Tax=Arthrobacter sp. H14-L1 TaxID=2996697 RepID=UPI00226FEF6D|nr:DUF4245 domain-containing protein [Arthrobacter sp. H14-L1]MCY0904927.1 DUF4245 domain-containing protein [Arthrobacter sp. H14-L1]